MRALIFFSLSFLLLLVSCQTEKKTSNIDKVFSELLSITQKRQEIVTKAKQKQGLASSNPEYVKISQLHEDYLENHFLPILPTVKQEVCENKNNELFESLMQVLSANQGAAEEALADIQGEIFICRPDFVLRYVEEQPAYHFFMGSIDFGFRNYKYNHPKEPGLAELQTKLDSMNRLRPFRGN
jgi:hypothetical protein